MRGAAFLLIALLTACSGGKPDPRGADRDKTVLSVSATGRNEMRPDMAIFSAGVETFGKTGPDASAAPAAVSAPPIRVGTDINEVVVSVDFALEPK
jgi:uncharacterized protein YggE